MWLSIIKKGKFVSKYHVLMKRYFLDWLATDLNSFNIVIIFVTIEIGNDCSIRMDVNKSYPLPEVRQTKATKIIESSTALEFQHPKTDYLDLKAKETYKNNLKSVDHNNQHIIVSLIVVFYLIVLK